MLKANKLKKTNTTNNKKPRFNRIKSKAFVLPSLITVISLFFGFVATINAFNSEYEIAATFILFSVIADACDGRVARRLNVTSDFGKELDSLSDLIAFGMAPAIILYTWGFYSMANEFGIVVAFIYLACGAMRLARFNVGASSANIPKNYFQGLPIPGGAGIIAILCFIYPEPIINEQYASGLIVLSILVSALMVSSIPYPSAKNFNFKEVNKGVIFITLALVIAFLYYNPKVTLALGFLGYGLSGIILSSYNLILKVFKKQVNTI
ncbi:MAG: CDP-diacylglycerol--serine O-phosphatidyltransferase [Deltaproteobacteria bacterium]|jgi:CDP-diacylglycerol--serine O-phosphatidyltransferase|nr:CDP-diacylglycerol--serine O-phosphatidyltransferase [Deltaproteobacteria bacterium]